VRTDSAIVRKGLRILGMAIRTRPRPFAVSIVGACLYGGMTVAASVVIGRVTDRVIVPAFSTGAVGRGTLALAAAAILGVAVFKAVGIVLRRVGASIMQYQLHAEFRRRVTRRYLRLPLSWHSAHPTGELLSNANADVEAAFAPIAPLPMSAGVALMLLITGVLLVTTDPFLALIGFAVGPAIGLVNWRYNRRVQGPTTRAQQLRAEVSGIAHESFDGALVVKTLGRERQETDRFRASSEALRDQLVRLGRLRAVFDPLLEALPQLGVLAVLLVGTWRVAAGQLTQGSLVQFAYLFLQLAFPIRIIGYLLAELPRSVVGWERVERVLSATGEAAYPDAAPGGHAAATGPAHAALDDVTFRYTLDHGELHEVLRSVAFAAEPGRILALVGATGAGKSTIASLLVRLADPDEGAVRLDGRDVRTLPRGAVAREAAIVFQHTFLFDDTVRANVTLGAPFDEEDIWAALDLAQARGFVEALPAGLDTVIGERGTSLSGGQRQRLALARALVRRPRLLILDDATSSVDTAVESAILDGLRRAALPSTIVVVAYRRATIALADEIAFLAGGQVRARGRHAELLESHPAYARLVTAYDEEPAGAEAAELAS